VQRVSPRKKKGAINPQPKSYSVCMAQRKVIGDYGTYLELGGDSLPINICIVNPDILSHIW